MRVAGETSLQYKEEDCGGSVSFPPYVPPLRKSIRPTMGVHTKEKKGVSLYTRRAHGTSGQGREPVCNYRNFRFGIVLEQPVALGSSSAKHQVPCKGKPYNSTFIGIAKMALVHVLFLFLNHFLFFNVSKERVGRRLKGSLSSSF